MAGVAAGGAEMVTAGGMLYPLPGLLMVKPMMLPPETMATAVARVPSGGAATVTTGIAVLLVELRVVTPS